MIADRRLWIADYHSIQILIFPNFVPVLIKGVGAILGQRFF
jgi:hypothetical protein